MPTETLSPVPVQKFWGNDGRPLNGGKLFTYVAGTSTKLATYTDSTGASPNTNPIILDYRGECRLWVPPNTNYKYVLAPATDTDPPTNPIWTVDQVTNAQLITLFGGVDTGSANAYVITFVANFSAYTDGIVIYWIPSNTNTGPSTLNVNGLGAINIVNADGSALSASSIQANVPAIVLYRGGTFTLVTSISSTQTGGTFTATITGCTTAPTQTVTWAKSGRIVTLVFPGQGALTSNSVNFGFTGLPTNLQLGVGAASVVINGVFASDNSVGTYAAGGATIFAASGSVAFNWKGNFGAWTAAGTKSMGSFVLTYPVASNFT